jgi:putative ABC transport system permease protein
MLAQNLKNAFRNIGRHKLYSLINIGGLAMGLAAFLLILEYISFEKSVNNFHEDLALTYRLLNEDGRQNTWSQVEPGFGPVAKERIGSIADYCRFEDGVAQGVVRKSGNNTEAFREQEIGYAEGNFFSFFSFDVLQGNPKDFARPFTCFISEAAARKYFGRENPVGQQLELNNQFGRQLYTVAGVYRMPGNSDIRFDMVFSLETLNNKANLNGNDWAALDNFGSQYIYTFFKLRPGADYQKTELGLNALRKQLAESNDGIQFRLQPFSEVHLPPSFDNYYQTTGNLKYVYILGLIAVLILLIAWFNYINLSTANALKRAGEVGVRKVMGASRKQLVGQFLTESAVVNLSAFALALVLVTLLQPYFNGVVDKPLSLGGMFGSAFSFAGLGLLVAAALGSGAVIAYRLSGFNPIQTLKGKISKSQAGIVLRKVLVVTQFSISISLIMATLLIYQQLRYMQNKNLGANTAQVLVIRGPEVGKDSTYSSRRSSFENALGQQAMVQQYALSGSVPGSWYNFVTEGFTTPRSKSGDEMKAYSFAIVDHRYLGTYQIPLVAGRNFSPAECAVEWNNNSKVLINETALRSLGFEDAEQALQTAVQWDERPLQVIGVVKDYHHSGLQRAIDPMIFYPQINNTFMSLRLGSTDLKGSIGRLEKLYKTSFPGNPFEFYFADENFNRQYLSEQQYGRLFSMAAIWAIAIACLGLFALTTFSVQQRTREVGIRKVLGASAFSITRLIAADFLRLVALAALIAFPITWFSMNQWLKDFAYRISFNPWVFALAALGALLLALITIGFKAIRAALANPVKSIRTE